MLSRVYSVYLALNLDSQTDGVISCIQQQNEWTQDLNWIYLEWIQTKFWGGELHTEA